MGRIVFASGAVAGWPPATGAALRLSDWAATLQTFQQRRAMCLQVWTCGWLYWSQALVMSLFASLRWKPRIWRCPRLNRVTYGWRMVPRFSATVHRIIPRPSLRCHVRSPRGSEQVEFLCQKAFPNHSHTGAGVMVSRLLTAGAKLGAADGRSRAPGWDCIVGGTAQTISDPKALYLSNYCKSLQHLSTSFNIPNHLCIEPRPWALMELVGCSGESRRSVWLVASVTKLLICGFTKALGRPARARVRASRFQWLRVFLLWTPSSLWPSPSSWILIDDSWW